MPRDMNKFVIVINSLFAIIGDGAPPPEDPLTHTLEARFALFPKQYGPRFAYVWPSQQQTFGTFSYSNVEAF